MVYQVCKAVHVPVVGLGGIATAEDEMCIRDRCGAARNFPRFLL